MVQPHPSIAASTDAIVTRVALQLLLAGPDALDGVILDALRAIGELDRAHRVYITMYELDGTFRNSHEWLADGVPSHQSTIVDLASSDFPWSVGLAERGEIVNIASLDEIPPEGEAERRSFAPFGVTAILQVPMFVDGRLRGLVGVNRVGEIRRCSEATVVIVTSIADAMAVALLRRDRERALVEARDAAERANRARDEFLSLMSHELRTPLHAILGFTELLRFERLGPSALESVDRIDEAGHQLLSMVDDLFAAVELPAPPAPRP